jgi:hypothetical protein
MSWEDLEELTFQVPQPDGLVPTRGGNRVTIRAKTDAIDPSFMSL